jgi:hypothetical protein
VTQAIDIICNLFTPTEVENDQTGLDDAFKAQVRMAEADRGGVEIDEYLRRMDEAGIEKSFLAAVRCGDLRVKGSYASRKSVPFIPTGSAGLLASIPRAACRACAISRRR